MSASRALSRGRCPSAGASILLKHKVPLQHVQRLLRHSTPTITASTYNHMVVEDLRDALNVMRSGPVAVPSKGKKPA